MNDLGVDLISRADVNRITCEYRDDAADTGYRRDLERAYGANAVGELISELPSVTPQEPKTGHWFVDERPESDREIICSNCEQPIFKYHKMDFDYRPKYCPNCGTKMFEPQESEVEE